MNFQPIQNGKCVLYAPTNCLECRATKLWRESVGTPEICPHSITLESLSNPDGLGTKLENLFKPIARGFKMPCLDEKERLKIESPCFSRKQHLNAIL